MIRAASPNTNPVTLNLFQGPSCRHAPERSVARWAAFGLGSGSALATKLAEKWTLKQVQGDEIGEWGVGL